MARPEHRHGEGFDPTSEKACETFPHRLRHLAAASLHRPRHLSGNGTADDSITVAGMPAWDPRAAGAIFRHYGGQ
jgi:hypothetical protein